MASSTTIRAAGVAPASQAALPTLAPGFNVAVYAQAEQPEKLSFAPDGVLYVGTGQGDRIFRVPAGGGPGARFGPPQDDPDAVLFDAAGRISGVRNAVLVGGGDILAAIFPDGTSAVIFDTVIDVDDMKFDRTGRLVFSEDAPRVSVSSGATPTVLFSTPSRPASIAIDQDNRIFVVLDDGTIRIYRPDGTPDGIFARGLATGLDTYVIFGDGAGGFGRFLYVLSGSTLLRFTGNGKPAVIGSGFSVGPASATGFVFGPDHALYVSEHNFNRILRIARGNPH